MAINKIQQSRIKTRKIIDVSLLVIRITKSSNVNSYTLTNSRPCIACMSKIQNSIKYGYRISKIYFSNENGDIVFYKLKDIIMEKPFISKFYRKSYFNKSIRKFLACRNEMNNSLE